MPFQIAKSETSPALALRPSLPFSRNTQHRGAGHADQM